MQNQNDNDNEEQAGMASEELYIDDAQEVVNNTNCCSLCNQYVCKEFCNSYKLLNIIGGTLLAISSTGLKVGSIFLLNKFVSHLAPSTDTDSRGDLGDVIWLVTGYTGMLVGAEVCTFLSSMTVNKPIIDVSQKIATRLIEHVIKIPMARLNELMLQDPSGLLASIPYNMKSFVLKTTVEGIPHVTQLVGVAIASAFLFEKDIVIVEAILGVVYLFLCLLTAKWMHQAEKNYTSAARYFYRMEIGQEDYLLTTKIFNTYNFEQFTAQNIYKRLSPLKLKLDNIEKCSSLIQQIVLCLGTGCMLAITGNAVLDPERPKFTMENFIASFIYFQLFVSPLVQMGQSFLEVSIHIVAIRRIAAIFEFGAEQLNDLVYLPPTPRHPIQAANPSIEFNEVCFRYPSNNDTTYTVNHLSFSLNPGQTSALVGSSGIGKSTILKLILRLFDISAGTIEIAGQNITEGSLSQLRTRIGYIEQKTKIFYKDSMKTNLAYGSIVSDEHLEEVLHRTELLSKAKRESTTFHDPATKLRPDYKRNKMFFLSGGEALKVGITRALQQPKEIYLLDEPTASLDSISAHQILTQLSQLLINKTAIIISHQLLHMISADLVIYVHDFALPEQPPHVHYFKGTHAELLDRNSNVYQNYLAEYPMYIREYQRLNKGVLSAQEYADAAHLAYHRCYSLQAEEKEYRGLFSTNRAAHFQPASPQPGSPQANSPHPNTPQASPPAPEL